MVLPYRCTGKGPWKLREEFESRKKYRKELREELAGLVADEREWDQDRMEVEEALVGLVHEAATVGEAAEKERKLLINLQNKQLKKHEALLHNIKSHTDRETAERDMAYSINLVEGTPGKEHAPFFGSEARERTYQEAIMHALHVDFTVGTPTGSASASDTTIPPVDTMSVESLQIPPAEVFQSKPSYVVSDQKSGSVFENTFTSRLSPDPISSLNNPNPSLNSQHNTSDTIPGSFHTGKSSGIKQFSALTTPQERYVSQVPASTGGVFESKVGAATTSITSTNRLSPLPVRTVFDSQYQYRRPVVQSHRLYSEDSSILRRGFSVTTSSDTNLPFTTASQFSPEELPVFGGGAYSVASPTPSASLPSPVSGIWMSNSSL